MGIVTGAASLPTPDEGMIRKKASLMVTSRPEMFGFSSGGTTTAGSKSADVGRAFSRSLFFQTPCRVSAAT